MVGSRVKTEKPSGVRTSRICGIVFNNCVCVRTESRRNHRLCKCVHMKTEHRKSNEAKEPQMFSFDYTRFVIRKPIASKAKVHIL